MSELVKSKIDQSLEELEYNCGMAQRSNAFQVTIKTQALSDVLGSYNRLVNRLVKAESAIKKLTNRL